MEKLKVIVGEFLVMAFFLAIIGICLAGIVIIRP